MHGALGTMHVALVDVFIVLHLSIQDEVVDALRDAGVDHGHDIKRS